MRSSRKEDWQRWLGQSKKMVVTSNGYFVDIINGLKCKAQNVTFKRLLKMYLFAVLPVNMLRKKVQIT